MGKNIFMSESNYAPLLAKIEITIAATDVEAEKEGIVLTDSQVRSTVNKAALATRGSSPDIELDSPRAKLLGQLAAKLVEARREFQVQVVDKDKEGALPVPAQMWINALQTVMDSIRTRTGDTGSRAYLDFVREFVRERLKVEV